MSEAVPATEGRVTLALVYQEVRRSEDRTTNMVEALQQRMELLFKDHGQTHEKHDREHGEEERAKEQRARWTVTTVLSGGGVLVGLSGWAAFLYTIAQRGSP